MKEFEFLNYCTTYKVAGTINGSYKFAACFSQVFSFLEDTELDYNDISITYTITLYKGLDYLTKHNANNACFLSKYELRNHLRILRSIYPINYKVLDHDDNTYKVILKIEGCPKIFHKYALTWVRYAYEFPYNVLLQDVHKLKLLPIFRFESIFNLLHITISCYAIDRSIHQIPSNNTCGILTTKEIKDRLPYLGCLNDIFSIKNSKKYIPNNIDGFCLKDMPYWEFGFEERKPIYLEKYKKVKDESIRSRRSI